MRTDAKCRSEPPTSYSHRLVRGLCAALLIGGSVVAVCNTVWAVSAGLALLEGWDEASGARIALVSFPFVILALCGIRSRRCWFVGLCATVLVWAFYLWDLIEHDVPGAYMGRGVVMFFSPALILSASFLALLTEADGRSADDLGAGR